MNYIHLLVQKYHEVSSLYGCVANILLSQGIVSLRTRESNESNFNISVSPFDESSVNVSKSSFSYELVHHLNTRLF